MANVVIDRAALGAKAGKLSDEELAVLALGRALQPGDSIFVVIDASAGVEPFQKEKP